MERLLVGLELHQQLASSTKLFCACPTVKTEEFPGKFERRLRPAQSETGHLDPAAVFEFAKGRSNLYFWNPESSCLVEADEEPPHPLSREALRDSLLIAATLGSHLMGEVHVMRKIVIDGSNTTGFQRTAVVGLGGSFDVDGVRVGVQTVTLEEDAARILGEDDASRHWGLDRLGVPLVEIALEPVDGDPDLVGRVALHLGRVLRSTGKAARGLGTIRQDMNVSLGGGKVVEVKGVQKLNLLPKVVEYERRRQSMLRRVAEELQGKGARRVACVHADVTGVLRGSASPVVSKLLSGGAKAVCIAATGLGGLLGWEPEPGVRLGKELAEVARANGVGGVIHSDEFEKQGIQPVEEAAIRRAVGCGSEDALVIVAGRADAVDRVVPLLADRLGACVDGVPAETRAPTDGGETRYMRPRAGSQRMYPETDVPDITVTEAEEAEISREAPEDWRSRVGRLEREWSLSRDLALKLYDADEIERFEELARRLEIEASFIASVFVDLPARLSREGVAESGYSHSALAQALEAVASGVVAKEAVPDVLKAAWEKGMTVEQAAGALGLERIDEVHLAGILDGIVSRQAALIREKGDAAFSPLMGEAMKELRGKADGALIARLLREKIAGFSRAPD
ncbi:MAG: Glu-tRNA(Gln) amidotransferase subunit GatE [Nitrososphaerota archaeon]|jgi:glutamyl-tRNA(Gln) amidotransferase subunit E|nr:Glu-tRNA(Gln) amidotransferase subunit GatE [Nitrososphaerota archaeon]MDG6918680.1 Glu-tRNA(Gln) amidotransferase subunit GatE [Nitrososphaerota archaeon]MDG6946699.1 Glu-tRNA(Gln) amidotransferase subunit GatE [Nitrososphaerota archaeon]